MVRQAGPHFCGPFAIHLEAPTQGWKPTKTIDRAYAQIHEPVSPTTASITQPANPIHDRRKQTSTPPRKAYQGSRQSTSTTVSPQNFLPLQPIPQEPLKKPAQSQPKKDQTDNIRPPPNSTRMTGQASVTQDIPTNEHPAENQQGQVEEHTYSFNADNKAPCITNSLDLSNP
jgi:hypothetical protein